MRRVICWLRGHLWANRVVVRSRRVEDWCWRCCKTRRSEDQSPMPGVSWPEVDRREADARRGK